MFARIFVLVLLVQTGCQVSRYAERGDAAMASGDHSVALANYRVAVEESRSKSLRDRRDRAALAVVDRVVDRAQKRYDGGDSRAATEILWAVLRSKGWGSPPALAKARAELTALAERDLKAAKNWIELRRYEDAFRTLRRIQEQLPDSDAAKEASRIVIELQQSLVRSAAGAPANARRFRLLLAERYGADVRGVLGAQPVVFTTTGTATADCAPFLPERGAASPSGAALVVEVVLKRCLASERTHVEKETYSYRAVTARTTETVTPAYEDVPADPSCREGPCRRFDALGVCVERDEAKACGDTKRVLVNKPTSTVEYGTKTATATRDVHVRRHAVVVQGELQVRRSGTSQPPKVRSLNVDFAVEDRAFWSPHETRMFSRTLVQAIALARRHVATRIDEVGRGAVRDLAETRRSRLPAAGHDEGTQEDHFVFAMMGGAGVDETAERYFRSRYGLGPVAARDVLQRRAPRTPRVPDPMRLPPPSVTPWEDRWHRAAVRGPKDVSLRPGRSGGLDVHASIEGSPLDSASRAHGVGVRIMSTGIQLGLEAYNQNLGGEVGGFSLDFTMLHDLPIDGATFYWRTRLEELRTDAKERTQFLGVPVGLRFLVAPMLSVEAEIGLNLFALRTKDDADFIVPIHVGATVDVTRWLFLRARVVRYYNAEANESLHAGAQIGVRL